MSKVRVTVDAKGQRVVEILVPNHTTASKLLSWYAVNAPDFLNELIRALRVRR
jgi:hypothetical protein